MWRHSARAPLMATTVEDSVVEAGAAVIEVAASGEAEAVMMAVAAAVVGEGSMRRKQCKCRHGRSLNGRNVVPATEAGVMEQVKGKCWWAIAQTLKSRIDFQHHRFLTRSRLHVYHTGIAITQPPPRKRRKFRRKGHYRRSKEKQKGESTLKLG